MIHHRPIVLLEIKRDIFLLKDSINVDDYTNYESLSIRKP